MNILDETCRICGCTNDDCRQCIAKTGQPCSWVDDDLCSACALVLKVRCEFTDGKGYEQLVTFDTYVAPDLEPAQLELELKDICTNSLQNMGFFSINIKSITHEKAV